MGPHRLVALLAGLTSLSLLAACGDTKKKPLGSNCEASGECTSGLCYEGSCVDPSADLDADGLTNGVEAGLGSDSANRDSDGDGHSDPDEVDGIALIDSDGDGKGDIIESDKTDADSDCVTDQYDSDDAAPTLDITPMVAAVCPSLGICAEQVTLLRAACPDGEHAVCVYGEVAGYADPEVACDGKDENCDGAVDEAFPGGCGGAPRTSFVGAGSAARTLTTSRYRATLVIGQPALGSAATDRYRSLLGTRLAPRSSETP